MRGKYKSFDPDLYREYNDSAIGRVLDYVSDAGLFARLNDDKYGPDVVLYKGFRAISYIEVEVVRKWNDSNFPWPLIHLPERKGKYLNLGLPIEFYRLNSSLNRAIIIPDYIINSSQLSEVRNSLVESGELFYRIPIELCMEISLIGE